LECAAPLSAWLLLRARHELRQALEGTGALAAGVPDGSMSSPPNLQKGGGRNISMR